MLTVGKNVKSTYATEPPELNMKIYFGHTTNEIGRISTLVRDKGVSLLRAAPSELKISGLFRIAQLGYEFYSQNLPAYMKATDSGKIIAISGTGYPVSIKLDDTIPIDLPQVFILMAGKNNPDKFSNDWTEFSKRKNKTGYIARFDRKLLTVMDKDIEIDAFAPTHAIRFKDMGPMITIHRVLSSFLRTHKFPAFANDSHFEEISLASQIASLQRTRPADDDDERGSKRRYMVTKGGEGDASGPIVVNPTSRGASDVKRIVFSAAKPNMSENLAWGRAQEIPDTSGVHFPFMRELSKPDKETLPRLIEKYFIRSLSSNTESSLSALAMISMAWKTSLFDTHWGHCISHLARVIELAIPSQGRVFPIVEDGFYFGSYLSGAGLSIAVDGKIFRPDTYETQMSEIGCYSENDALIEELKEQVSNEVMDDEEVERLVKAAKISPRAIFVVLRDRLTRKSEKDGVVNIVRRMHFKAPYRSVNVSNIRWMLEGVKSGKPPHSSEPQNPKDMFEEDLFIQYLSAFGTLTPAPNLPGAPSMKISKTLPDKFQKVIGLRLVDSEQSAREWKEVLKSGFMNNGMDNLSARYEHSAVSGQANKEGFMEMMHTAHCWFKEKEKEDGVDVVKKNVESEFEEYVDVSLTGSLLNLQDL